MDDSTFWFFGMYVLGTIIGFAWGYKQGFISSASQVIDSLIDQGVLKTSTGPDGKVEIHKWDETK
jgi:predicted nucleic acid-binding protein